MTVLTDVGTYMTSSYHVPGLIGSGRERINSSTATLSREQVARIARLLDGPAACWDNRG